MQRTVREAQARPKYALHNAPINVLPQVATTPRARVGDLTYMKSIASPLGRMLESNAPLRTIYFPPTSHKC
jgi:hypothetical protein